MYSNSSTLVLQTTNTAVSTTAERRLCKEGLDAHAASIIAQSRDSALEAAVYNTGMYLY